MISEFDRKEILKDYAVKLETHEQANHWAKEVEGWQSVTNQNNYPNYATVDSNGAWKGDLAISGGLEKNKDLISYEQGCELIGVEPIS